MLVGTILLTEDNFYISEDGKLPDRPLHDKQFLLDLCTSQRVSYEGNKLLPPTIRKVIEVDTVMPNIPITIRELALADLLLVIRSYEKLVRGKVFRLDNFKCILKDKKVEVWKRI